MAVRGAFGREEVQALGSALRVARDLTGQYYALPDDWFRANSHEICTLKELRQGEILGSGYLAQIRRVFRVLDEGPGRLLRCERVCPHYRICLQDHNLLRRASQGMDLEDLLTLVLTHEYVHMVRFGRQLGSYDAWTEMRAGEEAVVDRITRTIVGRLGHRSLRDAAAKGG